MNVGQLFIKLGFKQDPAAPAQQAKFLKVMQTLRDKANKAVENIRVNFKKGFDAAMVNSEKSMFGFIGKLGKLIGKANIARMAILGIVAAMTKLTLNTAQAAEHLFKFSLNTGMDTTSLQRWQQQAGMAGVRAEEVAESFKMLQQKSVEAQLGGDTGAFRLAGVNWMADAETQMKQIQTMLANRPAALGTKLALDMGLSEEMITFLRMRDSLQPANEGLILSKTEIAELKDFSIQFEAAWNGFKLALAKLGVMIMPITKPIIKMFSRIMEMTAAFTVWINGLGKWKATILTIAASIAVAVSAFFFPITATVLGIIAIIAGIALAIEDVYTYFQGGESFTGDFLSGKLTAAIKKGFAAAVKWVEENWTYLCGWMAEELVNIFNGIGKAILWIGDYLIKIIDSLLAVFKLPGISDLGKKLDPLFGAAGTAWGNMMEWFNKDDKKITSPIAPPTGSRAMPVPSAVGGAVLGQSGNAAVNQTVNIKVDGAKNPMAVADEINARIKKETGNAVYQMPRQEM